MQVDVLQQTDSPQLAKVGKYSDELPKKFCTTFCPALHLLCCATHIKEKYLILKMDIIDHKSIKTEQIQSIIS